MSIRFSALLLSCGLALTVPVVSAAATLGLPTTSPTLSSSSASIDYLEFDSSGDLSTFAAVVDTADGVSPIGATTFSLIVGYALGDPTGDAAGGFDVQDDNGDFLGGNLIAVGFTEDRIELQFGELFGAAAESFGTSALVELDFADALGPDPFAAFVDGETYAASITVSTVVPLPPAFMLLLPALGGLLLTARRAGGDGAASTAATTG